MTLGGSHSPYYCGPPPDTAHASHTGSPDLQFYDLDTELSYRCHQGYVRDVNKVGSHWSVDIMPGTCSIEIIQ